jgi:hypothetical protein
MRCYFFHRWSKWTVTHDIRTEVFVTYRNGTQTPNPVQHIRKIVQKRTCQSCGLVRHIVDELDV